MTPQDKEIIKKNPKALPHDLLTKHGLSQQGFDELVAQMDKDAKAASESKPPRLVPNNVLQPMAPTLNQPAPVKGHKVRLIPTSGGGLGTEMSRAAAEATMRRQPGKYKISNL